MVRDIAGFRVETLDEAIAVLEAVLMPEGVGTTRQIEPEPTEGVCLAILQANNPS
jgi:hypothetical protein